MHACMHAYIHTYSNYSPGEPNNCNGVEDCGVMASTSPGQWNDISCDTFIHAYEHTSMHTYIHTYSNYYPGEPNNYNGVEDCGIMTATSPGYWNDLSCDSGQAVRPLRKMRHWLVCAGIYMHCMYGLAIACVFMCVSM